MSTVEKSRQKQDKPKAVVAPTPTAEPKPARKPKPATLVAHELEWSPAEWSDDPEAQAVIAHGYELTVEPQMAPDPKATGEDAPMKKTGRWAWKVRSTSEVSETPELMDEGERASESGAKIRATSRVNKFARIDAKS